MNWKKTQMTEPQQRAQSIYDNMGKVEGNVHILQLQFFCDQLNKRENLLENFPLQNPTKSSLPYVLERSQSIMH